LTELERELRGLGPAVDWPATPRLDPLLEPQRRARRPRRPVVVAAVALIVAGLAIALAVPPARSGLLRFFHLGGVTIERVQVLPPAQQRPLARTLGAPATEAETRAALGAPFRLPLVSGKPRLYLNEGVVSTLLATPAPVLLSELRSDGAVYLKKLASISTSVEPAAVAPGVAALWISGGPHVVDLFGTPPRLAGNTLVWTRGNVTFRLEGPGLEEDEAVRLARQIDGT